MKPNICSFRRINSVDNLVNPAWCCFIVCLAMTRAVAAAEVPATPAQADSLMAMVWSEPPESVDIRFLQTVDQPRVTPHKARELVTPIYLEIAERKGWSQAETTREIEAEMARVLAENKHPGIFHARVRTQRHKYRRDFRRGEMGEPPDLNADWAETFTNLGDRAEDDSTNWQYHYDNQGASIQDTGYWGNGEVYLFGRIPESIATMLWFATGDAIGRKVSFGLPMTLNQQKLDQLISGNSSDVAIFCEESELQTVYTIRLPEMSNALFARLWIQKDLSAVSKWELYLPTTGKLVRRESGSGFFENGFPQEWNQEIFPAGEEPKYESFTFFEANLDANVPDGVFEYDPPKAWGSTDFRGGQAVTTVDGKVYEMPMEPAGLAQSVPYRYRMAYILFFNALAFGAVIWLFVYRNRKQNQ